VVDARQCDSGAGEWQEWYQGSVRERAAATRGESEGWLDHKHAHSVTTTRCCHIRMPINDDRSKRPKKSKGDNLFRVFVGERAVGID
jgi:hypothetical protein